MAKKIPITKTEARGKRAAADFSLASLDRMEAAKKVYEMQNDATRDAIDRVQSLLIRQSRRSMWVGTKDDRVSVEIPNYAIWNNALYMAVQIMKDLAFMDIKVVDFKWPVDTCMTCGNEITRTRKKAKR